MKEPLLNPRFREYKRAPVLGVSTKILGISTKERLTLLKSCTIKIKHYKKWIWKVLKRGRSSNDFLFHAG